MRANKWLEQNHWTDGFVEHELFSHHTTLSLVMEQYAKEYANNILDELAKEQKSKIKKFI